MAKEKEEKNRVLIIEQANTDIKQLVNNAMLFSMNRLEVRYRANEIIDKAIDDLSEIDDKDKDFLRSVRASLKQAFLRYYNMMVITLKRLAKKDEKGLIRQQLEKMDVPFKAKFKEGKASAFLVGELTPGQMSFEQEEITNLRDLMTVYDTGAAGRYGDYVGDIQRAIISVEDQIADGTLTIEDSLGRHKSVRNMAEIKTRYDYIQKDMERLKSKNIKYVMATSHADCSSRCQWWQGKIFLFDIQDLDSRKMNGYDPAKSASICKPIRKDLWVDGRETYSLKDAIECGFLSFNCQHRIVAYSKGMQSPHYDFIQIEKKRDISAKQRLYERKIRNLKQKQAMASSKERRKHYSDAWKEIQADYEEYCKKNHVAIYQWRTKITETERAFTDMVKQS